MATLAAESTSHKLAKVEVFNLWSYE